MAGHSQFKNIMHRKGAQDAKRAKAFTKIIRELTVAAKTGLADPEMNPRLRAAMSAAREANMPKDNVDRAIKRAQGGDDNTHYEEVRYEGYGPGSVAIIVEALTDNRNRTAPEVRSTFSKSGGNMGETGSVSFMFDRLGYIEYPLSVGSADLILEEAINAGADNVETNDSMHEIYTTIEDLHQVREALSKTLGEPTSYKLIWKPKETVVVDNETAAKILKLIDTLEDNDDVQNVWGNYEFSEEFIQSL